MTRRLLWPALTTAILVSMAVALGVWQLQRLHWKFGILAALDRAEASPPVPLPPVPDAFEKVEVSGTLDARLAGRYGSEVRTTPAGPTIGSQVLMPLDRPDGAPILVDLGWLPDGARVPAPAGAVEVVGYVRPAERASWFMPADDVVRRRFWALDPAQIGAALGIRTMAPFTLVALQPVADGIEAAATLPRPPNDHLQYAVTWFGLAGAGLIIFIVYARRPSLP